MYYMYMTCKLLNPYEQVLYVCQPILRAAVPFNDPRALISSNNPCSSSSPFNFMHIVLRRTVILDSQYCPRTPKRLFNQFAAMSGSNVWHLDSTVQLFFRQLILFPVREEDHQLC